LKKNETYWNYAMTTVCLIIVIVLVDSNSLVYIWLQSTFVHIHRYLSTGSLQCLFTSRRHYILNMCPLNSCMHCKREEKVDRHVYNKIQHSCTHAPSRIRNGVISFKHCCALVSISIDQHMVPWLSHRKFFKFIYICMTQLWRLHGCYIR